MFNRQPLNRGKFNTPVINKGASISGQSLLRLNTNKITPQQVMSANGGSELSLNGSIISSVILQAKGTSTMFISSSIKPVKIINGRPLESSLIMDTSGNHILSGESIIKLLGLVLKPGDELVIDTCEMTVTVNGINAMKYVSDDSDFFNLRTGDNQIVYTDGVSSRKISIDILWKDRWV